MPAAKTLSRILPAAVAVAVLAVPAVAQAKHMPVRAVIALGDHRSLNATKKKAAKKKPVKAVAAQACANTDLLPTAANLPLIRAAVLCLHNQTRAQQGLPALKENARLDKAALGHSNDMVAAGYFDHTTPGGTSFVDRILGAHYVKRTND